MGHRMAFGTGYVGLLQFAKYSCLSRELNSTVTPRGIFAMGQVR
jgi:hypothetical protein